MRYQTDDSFWIQGDASDDPRVSNGIMVYTTSGSVLDAVTVGDFISLSGTVAEFRSSSASSLNNLFATEINFPSNVTVLSSNNTVAALILGVDRSPPTQALSSLDVGPDGWLSVPNNQSLVSLTNSTLRPDEFGMDFWASLEGQLVTVKSPVATGWQNNFGEFWIRGDWPATGVNSRGSVTITFGECAQRPYAQAH